jgi:tripartite-type tricarboxylate transporter receptor subunit TctC
MGEGGEKPRLQRAMRKLALCVAALALTGAAARAETVEEFYKRTQVTMFVGSGAGGGFDEIGRVFAPHFARHLPGSPTVVIKNMPGAGGLLNVNYMYNQAPRDGSAFAAPFNTVFMLPLFGDPAAKFDPRKFTWLGSLDKQTGTCIVWNTSSAKTLDDARQREIVVGATGTNSTPAIFSNVLNTLLHTKLKVISGYSTNEVRFALERGETEGICGMAWQTYKAIAPAWVAEKKIRPIAQLGLTLNKDLPDVPMVVEMLKDKADRQVFELTVLPQEFGRPFIAPPDIPADRAAAMQKAFAETLVDPAFLADAAKIRLSMDPMTGDEIKALLDRAYAAPKDVVDRAAKFSVVN